MMPDAWDDPEKWGVDFFVGALAVIALVVGGFILIQALEYPQMALAVTVLLLGIVVAFYVISLLGYALIQAPKAYEEWTGGDET